MFFRYPADRLHIFLISLIFAVDVTVYLTVDSPWWLALYFLLGIVPKAGACAFNHHHQHVLTFHQTWLNRLLELMYALQTGVTSNAWKLHHSLGHHVNYLDQKKDESRWQRDDGSTMEEFEYANITTLTAYPRAWHVGASYKKDRRVFLYMGVLTVAVMAALVFYRPLPGLFVFVIAPLFSLWGTAWATYAHHANRSVENHFVACNNVVHRVYNFWTGNLGFHTAHHYKPGVHWSKLPELHAQIADKIPADAYVEPGITWRWLGKSWFPSRNVADKEDRDAELTAPPTADLTA